MVRKLKRNVYLVIILTLSLSGCSAIQNIGKALTSSFKGFSIHFP
jgi:uncharacterized protein YceK